MQKVVSAGFPLNTIYCIDDWCNDYIKQGYKIITIKIVACDRYRERILVTLLLEKESL